MYLCKGCAARKSGPPFRSAGTQPYLCPRCRTGKNSCHAPLSGRVETDKDHVNFVRRPTTLLQRLRKA